VIRLFPISVSMLRVAPTLLTAAGKRSFATASSAPPSNSAIAQDDLKYILGSYARKPVAIVSGKGCSVVDENGKEYLDFGSGIAVSSIGHSDPSWINALVTQANKVCHVSNIFYSAPQTALAKRLVTSSGLSKAFFCNSGTEANEAALKFARKRAHIKNTGKKIIAFQNAFHGRTMGALATTWKQHYRIPFEPLIGGVQHCPLNDIDQVRGVLDKDTCAVIVEPIQGEAGVISCTKEFLQELRRLTTLSDTSLIFDEVQCGVGRTGRLWAHDAFGVKPDMVTLAKPLAGGLPIGAVVMNQAVADAIKRKLTSRFILVPKVLGLFDCFGSR